jgi:uncharacterized protein YndB with AHSA1/START domain
MHEKKRMTRVTQFIKAPSGRVYRALIDPNAIRIWKVPTGMTSQVHSFDARVGGRFRISLAYDLPAEVGKTTAHTDTYQGQFVELVPNERIVEIDEFETSNPELRGEMKITIELADKGGGTEVVGVHEAIPAGVSITDNETGWRIALEKLALLVTRS